MRGAILPVPQYAFMAWCSVKKEHRDNFIFTFTFTFTFNFTQTPIQWVPVVLYPRVKRLERETDHSPPSNAEVKNAWCYASTPQYVFMAWCLVKPGTTLLLHLSLDSEMNCCRTN
jgi:hypothetical protein